jgi:hypothetical protein
MLDLSNTSKQSNDITTALSEMTENTLLCYILISCTSSINTHTCTITYNLVYSKYIHSNETAVIVHVVNSIIVSIIML